MGTVPGLFQKIAAGWKAFSRSDDRTPRMTSIGGFESLYAAVRKGESS